MTVYVVVLILLFFMIFICRFIKESVVHRRRMIEIDKFTEFHKQLMGWSKEIVDSNIRDEFLKYIFNEYLLSKHILDMQGRNFSILHHLDLGEERKKVCDNWGKYIPSLLQEIREKKLNELF